MCCRAAYAGLCRDAIQLHHPICMGSVVQPASYGCSLGAMSPNSPQLLQLLARLQPPALWILQVPAAISVAA